jgi:hypothetical protein
MLSPPFFLVINSNIICLTSLYSNLLDQIIVAKVVKIFLLFYEKLRFIVILTRIYYWTQTTFSCDPT